MAIKKRYISPRQKMINLMYVVLLAMLALNVEPAGSTDGFPMKGNPIFRDSVPEWRILQDDDMRVNSIQAIVVPKTNNIFRGDSLHTHILLAAVDTTSLPTVYLNDEKVDAVNGLYSFLCNKSGLQSIDGKVMVQNKTFPFHYEYMVSDPSMVVAVDLTNILYAGIDNPIHVSVPGVSQNDLVASMQGGSLLKKANGQYVARPAKGNSTATITVSYLKDGRVRPAGRMEFRVRQLPDPTPYILAHDGDNIRRYRGGRITRNILLQSGKISAAVDDGILDIPFCVNGFETVFFDGIGNAIPMASNGASFSTQQQEAIRSLNAGKRFYISHVMATGPDGIQRRLDASMEIIIKN